MADSQPTETAIANCAAGLAKQLIERLAEFDPLGANADQQVLLIAGLRSRVQMLCKYVTDLEWCHDADELGKMFEDLQQFNDSDLSPQRATGRNVRAVMLRGWLIVLKKRLDDQCRLPAAGEGSAETGNAQPADAKEQSGDEATRRLLSVFTGGMTDDRFQRAAAILLDDNLNTNEKLTKIDAVIHLPAKASAERLGQLAGVTKQAVLKTDWWIQHRKGEKADEVGRRHQQHVERAKQYEPSQPSDDDE